MKNINYLIIILLIASSQLYAQSIEERCISCGKNEVNFSNFSSAVGKQNTSTGLASFASGELNSATGNYSHAMGYACNASANYSFAFGQSTIASQVYAFSLGKYSESTSAAAFSLGTYLKASDQYSMVIGKGAGYSSRLENSLQNTLMIGFNSTLPTFFVSPSDGAGTTGKIGIGNVTDPLAKLHIKSDEEEDATLFLQPSDWDNNFAELRMGIPQNSIVAKKDIGLTFKTGQDFIFEDGNVGIGIDSPAHPLHVNGTLMISSNDGSLLFAGDDKGEWGEWGIEYQSGGLNFWKPSGSNNFGNYFLFLADDGNVGIGTGEPGTKLDVAGDIRFTGQLYDANGLFAPSPWASDNNGLYYNQGNVGIGTSAAPTEKLEVEGNINFTGNLLKNGQPFETNKWEENGNEQIFYNDGNVGIGTGEPGAKLDVEGNLRVTGFQLDNNYVEGHILQSDANGNASWVEPPDTNDDDWVVSGDNVYRDGGKVGVGTSTPSSDLHVKSNNVADETTTFLKIENNGSNVYGSGITIIGKREGSGPVIIQKAGIGPSYTDGEGLRLAFFQRNKNNINGLSISTYMKIGGLVDYSDIFAETSSLFLRANKELIFRSGGNSPIHFETNGTNSDEGTTRLQINQHGQVGIGTTNHADNNFTLLTVAGGIHAKEVRVNMEAGGGADFVFDSDYDLPGIEEVENFIKTNRHLPGIPSANEMVNNGIDLGEMQINLLQKIEELTLYVIELKKENEEMRENNTEMKDEIEKLKRR